MADEDEDVTAEDLFGDGDDDDNEIQIYWKNVIGRFFPDELEEDVDLDTFMQTRMPPQFLQKYLQDLQNADGIGWFIRNIVAKMVIADDLSSILTSLANGDRLEDEDRLLAIAADGVRSFNNVSNTYSGFYDEFDWNQLLHTPRGGDEKGVQRNQAIRALRTKIFDALRDLKHILSANVDASDAYNMKALLRSVDGVNELMSLRQSLRDLRNLSEIIVDENETVVHLLNNNTGQLDEELRLPSLKEQVDNSNVLLEEYECNIQLFIDQLRQDIEFDDSDASEALKSVLEDGSLPTTTPLKKKQTDNVMRSVSPRLYNRDAKLPDKIHTNAARCSALVTEWQIDNGDSTACPVGVLLVADVGGVFAHPRVREMAPELFDSRYLSYHGTKTFGLYTDRPCYIYAIKDYWWRRDEGVSPNAVKAATLAYSINKAADELSSHLENLYRYCGTEFDGNTVANKELVDIKCKPPIDSWRDVKSDNENDGFVYGQIEQDATITDHHLLYMHQDKSIYVRGKRTTAPNPTYKSTLGSKPVSNEHPYLVTKPFAKLEKLPLLPVPEPMDSSLPVVNAVLLNTRRVAVENEGGKSDTGTVIVPHPWKGLSSCLDSSMVNELELKPKSKPKPKPKPKSNEPDESEPDLPQFPMPPMPPTPPMPDDGGGRPPVWWGPPLILDDSQVDGQRTCPPLSWNEYELHDQGGNGDCLYKNLAYLASDKYGVHPSVAQQQNGAGMLWNSSHLRKACCDWLQVPMDDSDTQEMEARRVLADALKASIVDTVQDMEANRGEEMLGMDPSHVPALEETVKVLFGDPYNYTADELLTIDVEGSISKEQLMEIYAEIHRGPFIWGEVADVTAAAWVLHVNICIYQENGNQLRPGGSKKNLALYTPVGPLDGTHTMCLWNKGGQTGGTSGGVTGSHYAAIIPTIKRFGDDGDDMEFGDLLAIGAGKRATVTRPTSTEPTPIEIKASQHLWFTEAYEPNMSDVVEYRRLERAAKDASERFERADNSTLSFHAEASTLIPPRINDGYARNFLRWMNMRRVYPEVIIAKQIKRQATQQMCTKKNDTCAKFQIQLKEYLASGMYNDMAAQKVRTNQKGQIINGYFGDYTLEDLGRLIEFIGVHEFAQVHEFRSDTDTFHKKFKDFADSSKTSSNKYQMKDLMKDYNGNTISAWTKEGKYRLDLDQFTFHLDQGGDKEELLLKRAAVDKNLQTLTTVNFMRNMYKSDKSNKVRQLEVSDYKKYRFALVRVHNDILIMIKSFTQVLQPPSTIAKTGTAKVVEAVNVPDDVKNSIRPRMDVTLVHPSMDNFVEYLETDKGQYMKACIVGLKKKIDTILTENPVEKKDDMDIPFRLPKTGTDDYCTVYCANVMNIHPPTPEFSPSTYESQLDAACVRLQQLESRLESTDDLWSESAPILAAPLLIDDDVDKASILKVHVARVACGHRVTPPSLPIDLSAHSTTERANWQNAMYTPLQREHLPRCGYTKAVFDMLRHLASLNTMRLSSNSAITTCEPPLDAADGE